MARTKRTLYVCIGFGAVMCNDFERINKLIQERKDAPFRGLDDATYINESVWRDFTKHKDLKRVRVLQLKYKYRWTDEQVDRMYAKSEDGWLDGAGVYRLFDYGKGENKVCVEDGVDRQFHEPQHDHIVSRSEAKALGWTDKEINDPSNIQYISAVQNIVKTYLNKEQWAAVSPTIAPLFKG